MPHPRIDNDTLFLVSPLFLEDETGRPTLTVIVRATFEILARGVLGLLEEQPPLAAAGIFWGDPETSSYKYEPEVAPLKPATDVAVIAHAWAPNPRATMMDVGVRIGSLSRGLRVFGERAWVSTAGEAGLTRPLPFESIPVTYDRAFGGWDRSAADPVLHTCERRNPSGRGFHGKHNFFREGELAPNIEDPTRLIRGYNDHPEPAGLGFTSPHWMPRAALGGTYDERWAEDRKPRLPKDFDMRYFNAGAPGLVSSSLRGDELVHAIGLVPQQNITVQLPGIPPPALRVSLIGEADRHPELRLDTVILDFEAMHVTQLWRARIRVREGANDLRTIELKSPEAKAFPRARSLPAALAANARQP